MPIPFKSAGIKPYNITLVPNTNDAELSLYGEVVDNRPVDWSTGEPVEGSFIVVDEFLKDIADLESRDNLTIHINSVGGSLYGGLSIYNRLKNMKTNVTTIIDGLAASAGGLIFQAGNTRKVNSASSMMIHSAASLLLGYYNAGDLKDLITQLNAGTKAAVNALAEASGNSADSVRSWVDKETWYIGQEIIDAGFADEMIESNTPVSMSLSQNRAFLIVNGISLSTRGMMHIPANIPVMPAADTVPAAEPAAQTTVATAAEPPIDNTPKSNTGGNSTMAINTIDELRAEYPGLVSQLETAANAAGVTAERARMQGIDAIAPAIGKPELVNSARYGDTPLTAEQLAFKAVQAQAAIGSKMLTDLNADTKNSGAAGVGAEPNGGTTEQHVDEATEEKAKVKETVTLYNKINGKK